MNEPPRRLEPFKIPDRPQALKGSPSPDDRAGQHETFGAGPAAAPAVLARGAATPSWVIALAVLGAVVVVAASAIGFRAMLSGATEKAPASSNPHVSATQNASPAATSNAPFRQLATPPKMPSGVLFTRSMPERVEEETDAIDRCLIGGGFYFNCYNAYKRDGDGVKLGEVTRRYLARIAMADAGPRKGYERPPGPPDGGANAEIGACCEPEKACGVPCSVMPDGKANGGFVCLYAAELALGQHDLFRARAAHAKACECDPMAADFPAYLGGSMYCDTQKRPAFFGGAMRQAERDDVLACARCDAARGRSACDREIARLVSSDPPLARWISEMQIPRCQASR